MKDNHKEDDMGTKKCLYYLFNVKGTVDRTIWNCLRDKRDFNEKLWKAEDEEN